MKIKFLPQLLIELKRSKNPPKLRLDKEYRITDKVNTTEELIQIKDDIKNPLWLPTNEEGVLFEYVKE